MAKPTPAVARASTLIRNSFPLSYSAWRSAWLGAFIGRDVLCRRMTGNPDLAGNWKRQTSATAKWVSIDFPERKLCCGLAYNRETSARALALRTKDSAALPETAGRQIPRPACECG